MFSGSQAARSGKLLLVEPMQGQVSKFVSPGTDSSTYELLGTGRPFRLFFVKLWDFFSDSMIAWLETNQ